MKAFEINRRIFALLNIYSVSENASFSKKCYRFSITGIIIATEFLALIASALFIVEFVDNDLENCLYAFFQVAALFSMIYMWMVAFCLRNKIFEIFSQFQQFYDLSNCFIMKIRQKF